MTSTAMMAVSPAATGTTAVGPGPGTGAGIDGNAATIGAGLLIGALPRSSTCVSIAASRTPPRAESRSANRAQGRCKSRSMGGAWYGGVLGGKYAPADRHPS